MLNDLNETKEKLAGREKSLTELTERKSIARRSLDQIKEEKLHTDIQLAKLITDKTKLEEYNKDYNTKITDLENMLNKATKRNSKMEEKILLRDKEMQNIQEEILKKKKEILNKDKEIQNLKDEIERFKNHYKLLEQELKEQVKKTKIEIKKFVDFKNEMSKAIMTQKIISKIKKLMKTKGFLSDKEFESFLNEIEESDLNLI